MKNVAIIIPTLNDGGAERSAGALAKALSNHYNVCLFLLNASNIVYDYGGTVIDLSQNKGMRPRDYLRFCKEKYQIDCAISFMTSSNVANIQTRGTECVIISERGALSSTIHFPRSQSESIKRFYNCADRIVSVAYGTEYDLIQNLGISREISTTIYNFINKQKIYEDVEQEIDSEILSFVGKSKLILNVGRLQTQKNQQKLLVQFAKLINEGEDVKLLIVGSGALHEQLYAKIEEFHIGDSVKIIPRTTNPFPYYKLADIFALTSDFEGLPNVVLEAMLLGTPVVAVDCLSGPRELLKGTRDYANRMLEGVEVCSNGVLVGQAPTDESGETEYFKDALKLLLHDDNLRTSLAENALRYMERYKNEDVLDRWIDVIEHTARRREYPCEAGVPEADAAKKLIVFGAGRVGTEVMREYVERNDRLELLCFAVTNKPANEEQIMGIPVYGIQELIPYKDDALVLVGVGIEYEKEVVDTLEQYGFRYAFPDYPFVI